MIAIAIDSSQDVCTLALGRDRSLLAEYHFHHKMNLLKRIIPNTRMLLDDAGLGVKDLDAVIVSLGPGSFTGLRIGVTVAKSLAYVLSKPIVGVGTLDAIARGTAPVEAEMICPMIFARADEVYWSLFDATALQRHADYAVSPVDEVLTDLEAREGRVHCCGSGTRVNKDRIAERLGGLAAMSEHWMDFARGAALLDLGMRRLERGDSDDPMTIAPLYVRKPTPVVRLEAGELRKS